MNDSPDMRDIVEHGTNGAASRDTVSAAGLAAVREATREIVRVVQMTAAQAVDAVSFASIARSLVPELAQVYEQRDVMGRELHALRDRIADLEARAAAHAAERVMFESRVATERQKAELHAQELDRCKDELTQVKIQEQRLRVEVDAATIRAQADREETMRLTREILQAEEDARCGAVGELESVREALATEQRRVSSMSQELARAVERATESEAELLRMRQQREAGENGPVPVEIERMRAIMVETERELLAAKGAHEQARKQIDKLSSDHNEVVMKHAQAVARLTEATEREARLRLQIASLEEQVRAHEEAAAHEATPVQEAPAPTMLLEVKPLVTFVPTPVVEPDAPEPIGDEEPPTVSPIVASDPAEEPISTFSPKFASSDPVEEEVLAPVADDVEPEPAVVPDAEPAEPSYEPEPVAPQVAGGPKVGIIDATEGWEAPVGVEAHALPARPEVCDRVNELTPDCCVVNIAAPGAVEAAVALRAAKIATPLWCCVADGDRALSLGRFEVIARPIDPQSVHAQLAPLAPQGAKVIMVGSDGAALIPLREGLLQGGMLVRTAWNLKQASDLAAGANVVILDLASESAAAGKFIVDLAARENAPLIVLIPGLEKHQKDFVSGLAPVVAEAATGARTDVVQAASAATAG